MYNFLTLVKSCIKFRKKGLIISMVVIKSQVYAFIVLGVTINK